ncbi:hypothetical protein PINS_up024448 [Pythium insidiosum]|nr:hypothetical protein PINS_up024448 [Pythium insidiosum]
MADVSKVPASPAANKGRFEALNALDSAKFSKAHVKAILVAGSGFFVDSYDNFIIGLMVPMIAYEYYHKSSLNSRADGWVKAASSWGNARGPDRLRHSRRYPRRKKIYGIELIILIVGALLCAFASWPVNGGRRQPSHPAQHLAFHSWCRHRRRLLPCRRSSTSEFASSKRRGHDDRDGVCDGRALVSSRAR